jgi:hypothetical protein
MKVGQKVYIPYFKEIGTIESIKGDKIETVKVGDKIIYVLNLVVKNIGTITKIIVFLSKFIKRF